MSIDTKKIQKFFNKLTQRYGDSVHSLAWESVHTQRMRFQVLSQIAPLDGMRVLDVGCGKADLLAFFNEKNIHVDYYGVDVSVDLARLAKRRYPNIQIFYRDFLQDTYYPEVDYALSSGIANLLTPNNEEYIEAVIKKMFSIARKGTAVNMLTGYAPDIKHDTGMYFYSPETMLKFAFRLTSNVVLRHDYLPNDFTLYLYKE